MILLELESWGWDSRFTGHFLPYRVQGFQVGRVILEHRHLFSLITETGPIEARVSGKFRYGAEQKRDFPVVGDWVVYRKIENENKGIIEHIIPRYSKISRKSAGNATEEQVLAANVDTIFLVSSLDLDFNPRRLERYLVVAYESGADPVILLSKADLCADAEIEQKVNLVRQLARDVPVHAISAIRRECLDALQAYCKPKKTVVILGSSGVGKSTLINCLKEEEVMTVGATRADGRGRHTTTHRQLVMLANGGMLIDTPGLRELQLWVNEHVDDTFYDIKSLSEKCKFRDCTHQGEPGCQVAKAIREGALSRERFQSYLKLLRESEYIEGKENVRKRLEQKQKLKKMLLSIDRKRNGSR